MLASYDDAQVRQCGLWNLVLMICDETGLESKDIHDNQTSLCLLVAAEIGKMLAMENFLLQFPLAKSLKLCKRLYMALFSPPFPPPSFISALSVSLLYWKWKYSPVFMFCK